MTEKRFVGLFQGNMLVSVKDTKTNNRVNIVQIIEIGNKLNDENEQLKIFLEALKEELSLANRDNGALEEENEQLKQLLDEAEDIILCQCTPHYQRQWENIKKNLKR